MNKKLKKELFNYIDKSSFKFMKKLNGFSGITSDSRKVEKGNIFVAIKGITLDGHDYISQSINKGAALIVCDISYKIQDVDNTNVIFIKSKNVRKTYAILCKDYYGCPDEDLTIIGVTGTNGKTTTTYMLKSILEASGLQVGLIGTIEYRVTKYKSYKSSLTTPDASELYKLFAEMKNSKTTHVVLELSSHALELDRVYGLSLDILIFTNLTRDHLDFHHTMDKYFKSKMKSLYYLSWKKDSFLVSNIDSPYGQKFIKNSPKTSNRYCTYSLSDTKADFFAKKNILDDDRIGINSITISHNEKFKNLTTNMLGIHNIYNVLAAYAACYKLGIDKKAILKGLKEVTVLGRFESFTNDKKGLVIVDFAHTDDALRNTLETAKKLKKHKLITLFGCGGNRDQTKRSEMGRVAGELSDFVVITSDNPRNENPNIIISQIEEGLKSINFYNYKIIIDRKEAIGYAIEQMNGDDVLVIAGKGHEDYQVIGSNITYFSDQETVQYFLIQN